MPEPHLVNSPLTSIGVAATVTMLPIQVPSYRFLSVSTYYTSIGNLCPKH